MDMQLRSNSRIVIERAERQAEDRVIAVEPGQNGRSADAAEPPMVARRRLIERQQIFAGKPMKIGGSHPRARSKRSTLRLAAHRAMTIERSEQRSRDFISYFAAQ